MSPRIRIGGYFAPPLSDEILAQYKAMIDALPASALKDGLLVLHNCASKWWEQPESQGAGTRHPLGVATIVPLDEPIAAALWDHIPWKEEIDAIRRLVRAIPGDQNHKPLRKCANHLVWHARELEKDREPLTNDKL